jgi:hypothetical protein
MFNHLQRAGFTHPTDRSEPVGEGRFDISAALALAATVAGEFYFRSAARGANTRPRIAGTYGWFIQEGRKKNHKRHQEHKEDKEAITNTCGTNDSIQHFFSL